MKVGRIRSRLSQPDNLTPSCLPGEGGPFALYQGLYPPKFFETAPTHDSLMVGKKRHRDLKSPTAFRWPMLIWVILFPEDELHLLRTSQALLGTSLTMADGVLTAAVSVTSAVGGIGEPSTMSVSQGC